MFRFREICEIKPDETKKVHTQHEEYKQIKPETDITVEEARNFWDELFG